MAVARVGEIRRFLNGILCRVSECIETHYRGPASACGGRTFRRCDFLRLPRVPSFGGGGATEFGDYRYVIPGALGDAPTRSEFRPAYG